jgi:hypothetical protein
MSCRFIYSRKMPESHSRRSIPADGEALVDEYNAELARLEERSQNTWFTAPWLYAEYAFSVVAGPLSRDFHTFTATRCTGATCEPSSLPSARVRRAK